MVGEKMWERRRTASTQQSIEKAMSQFSHHRRNLPDPIRARIRDYENNFFPYFNVYENKNTRQHLSDLNRTIEHVWTYTRKHLVRTNKTTNQKMIFYVNSSFRVTAIFSRAWSVENLSATVNMLGCVTWLRRRKNFPITVEGKDSLWAR